MALHDLCADPNFADDFHIVYKMPQDWLKSPGQPAASFFFIERQNMWSQGIFTQRQAHDESHQDMNMATIHKDKSHDSDTTIYDFQILPSHT